MRPRRTSPAARWKKSWLLAPSALCLALAACSSAPRRAAAGAGQAANPPAAATNTPRAAVRTPPSSVSAPALLPPAMRPVGRVVSVDEKAGTAIVEFSRYAARPDRLDGITLFARDPDLRPVARLEGTLYLRGLILGVKIMEGRAVAGDEVVLPAPAEAPPVPPAAPAPRR